MGVLVTNPDNNPLAEPPEITARPTGPIQLAKPVTRYAAIKPPYLIAHRGGAGIGPENSMTAFARSVELGCRYLETDVRTTCDNHAVAFHDATLDRTTDRTGALNKHNWRSVSKAIIRGSSEGIPLLEDVLGSFPGVRFMIDLKDRHSIPALTAAINRTNTASRVCLAGSWDSWLHQVRANCGPQLSLALGWRTLTTLLVAPRFAATSKRHPNTGQTFAHVPWRIGRLAVMANPTKRALIHQAATRQGLGLMVWTVDCPHDAALLLAEGVTGIITDYPNKIRHLWHHPTTPPHATPRHTA